MLHTYYSFIGISTELDTIKFANKQWEVINDLHFSKDNLLKDYQYLTKLSSDESLSLIPWVNDYLDGIENFVNGISNTQKPIGVMGELHQLRNINPRLRVIMSIGGKNSFIPFRVITHTYTQTRKFVSNVENMPYYGFDGVDIAWKYPLSDEDHRKLEYIC